MLVVLFIKKQICCRIALTRCTRMPRRGELHRDCITTSGYDLGHCDSSEVCTYWLSQFYELKACGFYVMPKCKKKVNWLSSSIVIAH